MNRPLTLTAAERTLLTAALRHSAALWPHDPATPLRLDTAAWLEGLPKHTQRLAMTETGLMDAADALAYYAVEREEVTSEALTLLTKLAKPVSVQARVLRKLDAARAILKRRGKRGQS